MLVHSQISTLHNGVSEQQAELRLDSQCEEMVNCLNTVNVGLRRRNPTSLIASPVSQSSTDYSYSYDRGTGGDDEEKYIITINASGISVIDTSDGTSQTVNYIGNALAYLSPFESYNGYSAVTVKDTTFITNRNKQVLASTEGSVIAYDKEAYVWIKYNEPVSGYTYSITIDGTEKTSTQTTTTAAANDLATQLNSISGITASSQGSVVKIDKGGADFTFSSNDSYGGQASVGFKGAVNTMSDLPKNMTGFDGVYVRVAGVSDTAYSGYFLVYEGGTWIETKDPLDNTSIDADTMPHELIREADGTFTFQAREYIQKAAGDDVSNETPYFVESYIKDVFFFANRLCFLSDNALNMSETGDYTNYSRTTVLSLLDTDPINVRIDAKQALKMSYAIENESTLLLFSDKAQFIVNTAGIVSPVTLEVKQSTAYNYNNLIRPETSNGSVFFVSKRNDKSAVYEYTSSTYDSAQRVGTDISSHVQSYIDGDIVQMASLPVHNMILLRSSTNRETIFVYKYMYDGETRVQASWSKWVFNGEVNSIESFNDTLYVMFNRYSDLVAENWVLAGGVWNDDKLWSDSALWQDTTIPSVGTLEKLEINPIDIGEDFLDAGTANFDSSVKLTKWIYSSGKTKDIRGSLRFKTIQLSSEDDSSFDLVIANPRRGKSRTVPAAYTTGNRKPMVMGQAKDMEITISSDAEKGFQINTVSYEGSIDQRSRKIT